MGKADFTKVARFEFRAGAWINISTWYEVEVKPRPDGMTALTRKGICESDPVPFTSEMAERLASLLEGCGITSWEREYEPVGYVVHDGDFWELRVVLEDGTVIESEGSNAWPDEYDRLEKGLRDLFPIE